MKSKMCSGTFVVHTGFFLLSSFTLFARSRVGPLSPSEATNPLVAPSNPKWGAFLTPWKGFQLLLKVTWIIEVGSLEVVRKWCKFQSIFTCSVCPHSPHFTSIFPSQLPALLTSAPASDAKKEALYKLNQLPSYVSSNLYVKAFIYPSDSVSSIKHWLFSSGFDLHIPPWGVFPEYAYLILHCYPEYASPHSSSYTSAHPLVFF